MPILLPIVHADSALQTARESLAACRAEIVQGARILRAAKDPSPVDVILCCDAILEYCAAYEAYEAACDEELVELAGQHDFDILQAFARHMVVREYA